MTQPAHGVERTACKNGVFSFRADPKAQTQVIYQTGWQAPSLPTGSFVDFSSNPFPPFVLSAADRTQGSRAYLSLAMSSKLIMYGQSLGSAMALSAWSAIVHLCLRMFSTSFLGLVTCLQTSGYLLWGWHVPYSWG